MRYVPPFKLKVMLAAFFATGGFGIIVGLFMSHFYLVVLGVINLSLGGLVGWIFLTREPRTKKKKRGGSR